jgi:starch phosphorylase
MPGTRYQIDIQARLPHNLRPLEQLANNLLYSWDRRVRRLFMHIAPDIWEQSAHNPKVFLRHVPQARLDQLAEDEKFLEEFHYVLSIYRGYREQTHNLHPALRQRIDARQDVIAYFCAEYGLHESLPLYSGGLGILAGDHLKAVSDLGLPFVAVGLMYRQGYFIQTIDENGEQRAHFYPHQSDDLPITLARNEQGEEIFISVTLANREVQARIWQAEVGHIRLILLDTDVPANLETDRGITFQLYGGDRGMRLAQEMVLGVGGVRALRALGIKPDAWHMNEGHAAFLIIERCREAIAQGMDFESALELVASSSLFTTHTPVPAGHDMFDRELIAPYLRPYADQMGINLDRLLGLGVSPQNEHRFNMTALGLRGSRYHNGVSAIHGRVASQMESYHWPQVLPEENPVGHVTNGVHVQTFLANEWAVLYDARYPDWRDQLTDQRFWAEVMESIPDQAFWDVRLALKKNMLAYVYKALHHQYRRNKMSEVRVKHLLATLKPTGTPPMVFGFARRFATYKRATLLFRDPERLARLLNNPQRPIVLLFAGKAHPQDRPGQDLIRIINDYAEQPEFMGKVFFIENYDLALSRQLVAGVDIWLNTPLYPLEACGTSGQKAGINGILNVSVLDGWWDEAYNGENGWAITPQGEDLDADQQERRENDDLLDMLENEIVPLYFNTSDLGYSRGWVKRAKNAIQTILPQFNSQRMVMDYVDQYYAPAIRHGRLVAAHRHQSAQELTIWKQRVKQAWGGVRLERVDAAACKLHTGEVFSIHIRAYLNGLSPKDVRVECVLGNENRDEEFIKQACYPLIPGTQEGGVSEYVLELPMEDAGLFRYEIRAFPHHPLLAHPFETGCMLWL